MAKQAVILQVVSSNAHGGATVDFADRELWFLCNMIVELLGGPRNPVEEWEFSTRFVIERDEAIQILEELKAVAPGQGSSLNTGMLPSSSHGGRDAWSRSIGSRCCAG